MGWIGYRLIIQWWTRDLDLLRSDQRLFQALVILGPACLFIGFLFAWINDDDDDDPVVIRKKERK